MDDPQPSFPGMGASDITRRANRISRRASKARRHLPVLQPVLLADSGFADAARAGVPSSRAACPDTRTSPCSFVLCRYHLFREDADTRAGRPGLANVPRGEHGWTLPVQGDVPGQSAGTTLRPAWLKYRGLEVERECKVYVSGSNEEMELLEVRTGTMDTWLAHLHTGERVLVFDNDSGELIAKASLESRGLVFDRALPEQVFGSSSGLTLTRVRRVESCALDLCGSIHSNEQVGDAIARHRTLVAREVKSALGKLKRAGFDLRDLVEDGG